jgi:hypothetical protein
MGGAPVNESRGSCTSTSQQYTNGTELANPQTEQATIKGKKTTIGEQQQHQQKFVHLMNF